MSAISMREAVVVAVHKIHGAADAVDLQKVELLLDSKPMLLYVCYHVQWFVCLLGSCEKVRSGLIYPGYGVRPQQFMHAVRIHGLTLLCMSFYRERHVSQPRLRRVYYLI